MRLPYRFGCAVRCISSVLARLFLPPPHLAASAAIVMGAGTQSDQHMRLPAHWASDEVGGSERPLPVSRVAPLLRQLCADHGSARYFSWAEDGGVYLYHSPDERPFARIAGSWLAQLGAEGRACPPQ
jgi:hypothetical protein